jgi:hypothetical protein
MEEQINKAYELVKNINFDFFQNKLAKYHDDIKPFLDAKQYRHEVIKAHLTIAENYADRQKGLTEGIAFMARAILREKNLINAIQDGEVIAVNLKNLGELVADCEKLIEFKSKVTPPPPQKNDKNINHQIGLALCLARLNKHILINEENWHRQEWLIEEIQKIFSIDNGKRAKQYAHEFFHKDINKLKENPHYQKGLDLYKKYLSD